MKRIEYHCQKCGKNYHTHEPIECKCGASGWFKKYEIDQGDKPQEVDNEPEYDEPEEPCPHQDAVGFEMELRHLVNKHISGNITVAEMVGVLHLLAAEILQSFISKMR